MLPLNPQAPIGSSHFEGKVVIWWHHDITTSCIQRLTAKLSHNTALSVFVQPVHQKNKSFGKYLFTDILQIIFMVYLCHVLPVTRVSFVYLSIRARKYNTNNLWNCSIFFIQEQFVNFTFILYMNSCKQVILCECVCA